MRLSRDWAEDGLATTAKAVGEVDQSRLKPMRAHRRWWWMVLGVEVEDRGADREPRTGQMRAEERKGAGTGKYVHAHDGLLLWGLVAHDGGWERREAGEGRLRKMEMRR